MIGVKTGSADDGNPLACGITSPTTSIAVMASFPVVLNMD